jgi:hypothetical protein
MLRTGAAPRPVAPATKLATAPRRADGSGHAVRPLGTSFAIGCSPRPFAGWRDHASHRERHTRRGSPVRRTPRPCLIIADAGRAKAGAVGRRGNIATAIEHGIAGRRATIARVRGVGSVRSAAHCPAVERPSPKAKREKDASDLHDPLLYEKRTGLATRGNFAEAVLCGAVRTAAPPDPTEPLLNMTIDTLPASHPRFQVGMCDLARPEAPALAERRLPR